MAKKKRTIMEKEKNNSVAIGDLKICQINWKSMC